MATVAEFEADCKSTACCRARVWSTIAGTASAVVDLAACAVFCPACSVSDCPAEEESRCDLVVVVLWDLVYPASCAVLARTATFAV